MQWMKEKCDGEGEIGWCVGVGDAYACMYMWKFHVGIDSVFFGQGVGRGGVFEKETSTDMAYGWQSTR